MSDIITPDAKTWAEFAWPDWVPAEVRAAVEWFWADTYTWRNPATGEEIVRPNRGPQEWLESHAQQGAPPLGTVVTLPDGFGNNAPLITGRFVFAWNNIARLVEDDGSWHYTSFWPEILRDPESYRKAHLAVLQRERAGAEKRLAEIKALEDVMAGNATQEPTACRQM